MLIVYVSKRSGQVLIKPQYLIFSRNGHGLQGGLLLYLATPSAYMIPFLVLPEIVHCPRLSNGLPSTMLNTLFFRLSLNFDTPTTGSGRQSPGFDWNRLLLIDCGVTYLENRRCSSSITHIDCRICGIIFLGSGDGWGMVKPRFKEVTGNAKACQRSLQGYHRGVVGTKIIQRLKLTCPAGGLFELASRNLTTNFFGFSKVILVIVNKDIILALTISLS